MGGRPLFFREAFADISVIPVFFSMIIASLLLVLTSGALARDSKYDSYDKLKDPDRIWVLDCSAIHNVGNLHMNVTNWGCFGSYPNSTQPTADCPSAQWPANSGVEHLFIAGLWVGARKGGIPVVSTAAFEREFRPPGNEDPLARLYESFEGISGGARLPSSADDDNDGRVDEDWRNGVDDDDRVGVDGGAINFWRGIGIQMPAVPAGGAAMQVRVEVTDVSGAIPGHFDIGELSVVGQGTVIHGVG